MDNVTQETPKPAADTRGRYITVKEFSDLHPEFSAIKVYDFVKAGMPVDPRGGLIFLYEQEALAWIAEHVKIVPSYRIIKG